MDNKETLMTEMHRGAIIITPNNRLSHQLLAEYYARYATPSVPTLAKPRCLPYQAFLHHVFEQISQQNAHDQHPLVLTNAQQRQLWRHIIGQQTDYPCNDGLLHAVQEAWTRCRSWQIKQNHSAFAHTPPTRQFQQWQTAFQQALTERFAITEEQLVDYIMPFVDIRLSCHAMIWVCFDDYTPQQQALQQMLASQDYLQVHYDLAPNEAQTQQYAALNRQDEYQHMITWVKSRLLNGDQRIAMVIPDLQTEGRALQRLLQRTLPDTPFNLSLGKKLIDFPLIAHALHWLNLNEHTITHHQLRLLLHSPYLLGSRQEFLLRADIMQQSPFLKEADIPLKLFMAAHQHQAPQLIQALTQLNPYPQQASPLIWINQFKERLTIMGFPGEYPLESANYQCFQRLLNLLDELMQCAVITPLMTQQQALDALHDLANTTVFQLKQPTTSVQLLGLLEASGCTFDSIWVSGLTDQCLPQKTNFSAFIPITLQRELRMPHACTHRDQQLAEQLLKRLQHACQLMVVSYPQFIADTPHLASPLITHLPSYTPLSVLSAVQSPAVEQLDEAYDVPLLSTEMITGGTALLANQAKCPFRSFATHRLRAHPPNELSEGPDASERGQIMHQIMEQLWRELGDQHTLLHIDSQTLDEHITRIILAALRPLTETRRFSFTSIAQEVELNRLKRLVHADLEWEKKRPAFTVEAIEQTFTMPLAGINFKVRVDRLDRIHGNDDAPHASKMVIDYKTTLPANKPWNEDRPEAPQLLLYTLLDEQINALLFIQLKAGRIACSGFSEQSLPIHGMQSLKKDEHWADYQRQWHQQLTDLAHEFKTGHVPPRPKHASTCGQCSFPSLCRIETRFENTVDKQNK